MDKQSLKHALGFWLSQEILLLYRKRRTREVKKESEGLEKWLGQNTPPLVYYILCEESREDMMNHCK